MPRHSQVSLASLRAYPNSRPEWGWMYTPERALVVAYEEAMGFPPRPNDHEQWSITMNSRKGVKEIVERAKVRS